MRREIVLTMTIAAGLPMISLAAEPNWVMVAANDKFVEFLDTSSLAIRAGHLTAWILKNYTTPQMDAADRSFQSVKALAIYDCSADRSGPIDLFAYTEESGRGDIVNSNSIMPAAVQMSYTTPGSAGQKEIDAVCSLWMQSHPEDQRLAKR